MRIIIASGGTGGHIYPAITLAQALQKAGHKITFVGSTGRMEKDVIPAAGFDYIGLDMKIPGGSLINKANSFVSIVKAYYKCREIVKDYDLAIGFGNYISVPLVMAARNRGLKTVIHEQNSFAGKANKYLDQKVDLVIGSYEENKKTLIPGITFRDYHKKILFVVSEMTHFVIPLCLEYLREYKETPTNALLTDTFTNLFPIAQAVDPVHLVPLDKNERPCDVYQKLYAFVENRVKDSLKSDDRMWERQEFLGTIWKSITEDILNNKLLANIVPEYSFKFNIIHLNVSVVRKSIQDQVIRGKDPYSINCFVEVDSNTSDDDNAIVTEAEQFDSYNAKHDEFPIIIRHTFMEDTVNKILNRKNVVLNPNDIEFYKKNLSINEFQRFAIMSCFHSQFGGSENLYGLNQENWIKLMLCVVEMFKRGGSETEAIAKYVTAKRERHYVLKKETRVSRATLLNDPLYNYLINTKYKNVKNIINKRNNFIENKIGYILSNEFSYNTPIAELHGKTIPRNEDEIRIGVLKFFTSFIL